MAEWIEHWTSIHKSWVQVVLGTWNQNRHLLNLKCFVSKEKKLNFQILCIKQTVFRLEILPKLSNNAVKVLGKQIAQMEPGRNEQILFLFKRIFGTLNRMT